MTIRFYVDPDTDLPHIHSHEVDEQTGKPLTAYRRRLRRKS